MTGTPNATPIQLDAVINPTAFPTLSGGKLSAIAAIIVGGSIADPTPVTRRVANMET